MTATPARLLATTAVTVALAAGAAEAQTRDAIRIVGSSTVFPFATAVAEAFGQTTGFKTPVVEATGTGGGFRLFCAGIGPGHPDVVTASRAIQPSEIRTCTDNGVLQISEVKIGYDGIVLVHSAEAEPMEITRAQLWQALADQVPVDGQLVPNPYERWSEIDPSLPDVEIEVYGPPPTSGTRDAFVELVMDEGCRAFDVVTALPEEQREAVCRQVREDGAYVDAGENDNLIVQRLQANEDAFGIFGYSFLDRNLDVLQGVPIDGVEPTFEAIADGSYPIARPLFFYVKNAHVGVIPGIQEFVAEFTSDRAWSEDGYLAERGLIPLPEEEQAEVREEALALVPIEGAGDGG